MIEISNLSKRFADKKLFENVKLKLLKGNTYGVIGANGAGKSTFLKILSGEMEQSTGNIQIEKDMRISVLSQNQDMYNSELATEVVIMGNERLFAINAEKNGIYENPDSSTEDYEKAAELEELYGSLGGWNCENDAQILLHGLGVEKDKWELPLEKLPAADKVKVLLAKALFGNPDILIMDEPTNNLDLRAIKWLEEFLVNYENLVIVVSHDSDFLDQVCTNIVDIDFGGAKMFPGNYSFWKESSLLALELQQKQNSRKEDQIKKLQEFVARFSANASKSKQATSRKKSLEKITLDDIQPSTRKYPYIQWDLNRTPGKDILAVDNLSYTDEKGKTLFSNVSFSIHTNDKMVLIGRDDIAKTKLMQIIAGEIEPTTGTVKWGTTIKTAYFPRDNSKYFDNDEDILQWISKWPLENELKQNQDNADSKMRSFLGRCLFSGDSVFKKVKVSSGGEKVRLMFAKMMLSESNALVLDQPLDHLDTESIDSVIEGVRKYKSSVVFTTYNRTFIREVANVIFELKEDSSFIFRGTLKEYEEKMGY